MNRKFQIFVSSTFTDLKEDRPSAVSAILKAGHIPAGMELFTSADKSQMDTIRKWIEESDVYMLILGGRYGSIEASSGVSYTELEYDYAVELGKPLFAIVINEAALESRIREQGTDLMEKENPKQLKMFREKVLSNMSSFFEDSKDIRLCVYESLSDFSSNRELLGWVRADEVAQVQPLLEEVGRLNKTNNELNEKLLATEKKLGSSSNTTSNDDFETVIELLKATDIKIPPALVDGKEVENSLFDIFISNKESFITGITNQIDTGDAGIFLYSNIAPKLQIHQLVINEKVPSVRYRRFAITKRGLEILAYIEKKQLLNKA